MKKIFRFLSICTVFSIVFFSSIPVETVNSTTNKITVIIGENYGNSSEEVSIPIKLSNLPVNGLSSMNMAIEYDSSLIIADVKIGELISDDSDFSYSVKNNKVFILFSDNTGGNNPIKDDGILCYLIFKINDFSYKDNYIINRAITDNEAFADNNMKKIDANFVSDRIVVKDNLYIVQRNKTWYITFNQEIDPWSLSHGSVEVTDIDGQQVEYGLRIMDDGMTLEISSPDAGYNLYSSYTITIKNSFSSKFRKKLSKEQKINFYIER